MMLQPLISSLWTATAFATTVQVDFCVSVDIAFIDAAAGDRWTDDTVDKPARGFYYEVRTLGGLPVQSGRTTVSGTSAGCTGNIGLTVGDYYSIYLESRAHVAGNDVDAYDTSSSLTLATFQSSLFQATVSQTRYPVLPGATDDRWNHLAAVAYALVLHDANVSGETINIYEQNCLFATWCSNESDASVKLGGADRKFVVTHELGHLMTNYADAGGTGCNHDDGASLDNCKGDDSTGHGQLTKEYQSAAACEGMADFYSAVTWNELTAGGAEDCVYQRQYSLDWDEDGTFDTTPSNAYDCVGDPFDSVGADPDGEDWLEDMVDQTDGGTDGECTDSLTPKLANRGTQYDWLTYFWDLVSIEGVALGSVWQLWDAADPYDWNDDDAGASGDFPIARIEAAADALPSGCSGAGCLGDEHDAAKVFGVDH